MSKHIKSFLGVALLLGAVATTAWAGGPNYTYDYENRIPYLWNLENQPNGAVPVYTDLGNFKNSAPLITNERADELTVNGWNQWNNVPTSTFQAQVVGDFSTLGLPNIDRTNTAQVIGTFNGGGVHVIYDTDGQIFTSVLGLSGVLGIAQIEWVASESNEILESFVILNGSQVRAADPAAVAFSGVFTHEFGHVANLAHTQANGGAFGFADPTRPRGCPAPWATAPGAQQIETMYPFIQITNPTSAGTGMATVDRIDDIAAISNLYPAAGWPESHGTVRGKVLLGDEETEITAVNVIARNIADPFNDFTSYLSGQVSKGQAGPDGSFEFNGLTPGAQYVLYVDNLVAGGFNIPRLIVLPGPEEYYNGIGESGDGEEDDRCAWTTLTAAAAAPVTADIAFNKVKGAPVIKMIPAAPATATDMTPDGSVIVGATGNQVFRWTDEGGFVVIGGHMVAGGPAISDDGLRIAATARDPNNQIFWALHENGAWTLLPKRPDSTTTCSGEWGSVWDISGDGQTVVGGTWNTCASAGFRATIWTEATGTMALPKSPDSPTRASRANTVNYDGTCIGGWDDHSTGFRRGAYWMNGVETVFQPNPGVGTAVGEALNSNDAGTILTGVNGAPTQGGWRYFTSSNTMEVLSVNNGPNDRSGGAYQMSEDGSIIHGWNQLISGRQPTIWTTELGWFDFNLFLNAQGTYTEGIGIVNATTSSADGHRVAGSAQSQFGNVTWIMDTPKSVLCHRPPGHTGERTTTIDVSFPDGLGDHLLHGDTLGICQHGGV